MISYFRLWRLLERRGYSKKDITWLARISDSTYRKLLNSDSVRMDVLERICKALNVDVGDICSFRQCNSWIEFNANLAPSRSGGFVG